MLKYEIFKNIDSLDEFTSQLGSFKIAQVFQLLVVLNRTDKSEAFSALECLLDYSSRVLIFELGIGYFALHVIFICHLISFLVYKLETEVTNQP